MSDGEHQPLIWRPNRSLSSERIYTNKQWWNVIFLGTVFLLCCPAFGLIQHIQIIVSTSDGLGFISLAIYGSLMLSCLFAPFVINKLGTKLTIVFATCFHFFVNLFLFFSTYFCVNFFPWYATLILTVALGLSAAMLWVAQGTHLTSSAIKVAKRDDEASEFVINHFNGVFFFVFQLSQLIGYPLSLIVSHSGMSDEKPTNVSLCGKHSCGAVISSSAPTPSAEQLRCFIMIYCVIGLVAFLLSMCLDQQPSATSRIQSDTGSLFSPVVATVKLTGNWKLFLLIPVFMYSGMEQAFIMGDFTKAYVTCTLGVSHVGYVMAAFCLIDAVASLLVGWINKRTGCTRLLCLGLLVHFILIMVMLLWTPIEDIQESWQLYFMAAGWGIGDAVFQTQCASIVGTIFAASQSPAFSNYRFWQSAGFVIYFALSIPGGICMDDKLWGIWSWLSFSFFLYSIFEYKVGREINLYRQDDS